MLKTPRVLGARVRCKGKVRGLVHLAVRDLSGLRPMLSPLGFAHKPEVKEGRAPFTRRFWATNRKVKEGRGPFTSRFWPQGVGASPGQDLGPDPPGQNRKGARGQNGGVKGPRPSFTFRFVAKTEG